MKLSKKSMLFISFIVLTIVMFIAQMYINKTYMHFDSAQYWESGKIYDWHSTNLQTAFRGYLLQFVFFIAYKFGNHFDSEFLGYRILSSLSFAFLHTYVFDGMCRFIMPKEKYEDKSEHIVFFSFFL